MKTILKTWEKNDSYSHAIEIYIFLSIICSFFVVVQSTTSGAK